MEVKIVSTSDTEIVIEVTKDMPAMDGIYRNWISSIKVVDGSKIANGKINDIKYTAELIAPNGNTIDKSTFSQNGEISGSNVETYARIKPVKPVKPKDPENKPAVVEPAEPAKEEPKREDTPKEIKAPNTGFEKVANVLAWAVPALGLVGTLTAVVFRKKLLGSKVKF